MFTTMIIIDVMLTTMVILYYVMFTNIKFSADYILKQDNVQVSHSSKTIIDFVILTITINFVVIPSTL